MYNSVLLDKDGIVKQVRTLHQIHPVERYILLYTFSARVEEQFRRLFLPFRFYIDEGDALQDLVLAGCDFINQRLRRLCYAELVIVCHKADCDIGAIVQPFLFDKWKAFAWRKIKIPGYSGFSISLQGTVRIPVYG